MSNWSIIENGVVKSPRPQAEKDVGAIEIPDWILAGDTTPDNGVTFYRKGALVAAPPITWTALEFLSKFTDVQKIMLYRAADTDDGLALLMMHLFTAQEVISDNPMTLGARAALLPVLGESETVRIFDQQ